MALDSLDFVDSVAATGGLLKTQVMIVYKKGKGEGRGERGDMRTADAKIGGER